MLGYGKVLDGLLDRLVQAIMPGLLSWAHATIRQLIVASEAGHYFPKRIRKPIFTKQDQNTKLARLSVTMHGSSHPGRVLVTRRPKARARGDNNVSVRGGPLRGRTLRGSSMTPQGGRARVRFDDTRGAVLTSTRRPWARPMRLRPKGPRSHETLSSPKGAAARLY